MSMMRSAAVAAVMLAVAAPAAAQFSDSYNFLKAVKDKDAAKAMEYIQKPGNTVINTKDSGTGEAALHIVAKRGDPAWLGFLLKAGANPNVRDTDGNTPLMLVTVSRWSEGTQLLIAFRAKVNDQNRLGETALLKAVQNRDSDTAKLLIDAGASPDVSDNSGANPRSLAASDPRATPIARLFAAIPVRAAKPMQGPSI